MFLEVQGRVLGVDPPPSSGAVVAGSERTPEHF